MNSSTTYTQNPMGILTDTRPRYRWRTTLRGYLPASLLRFVPKGAKDCGEHEWYRADDATDRCYHCVVGERPHEPMLPTAASIEALERAAEQGSEPARDALQASLREGEQYLAAHSPVRR